MKLIQAFKILTISLFIASCGQEIPRVNTDGVNLELNIKRLEQSLFENQANLDKKRIDVLKKDYGTFYQLYVEGIIAVGNAEDSSTTYYLNHFKNDPTVREVADQTQKIWPDIQALENELASGFKRYKVLFPDKIIPKVYTYISAFSYTIVVDDSLLGIGLDMYLGRDNTFYKRLAIPAYKTLSMSPPYAAGEALRSWISTEFEFQSEGSDLLSNMIYHGKLLYALDLLLPELEDSIKIGYTTKQMNWMKQNEKDVWFHFANQDVFYNKDLKTIQNYIGEGPFTPGFPEGSPGRAGRWVGWQIVKKYMEQNNPLDLEQLFNETDAQKIFSASKYKPK